MSPFSQLYQNDCGSYAIIRYVKTAIYLLIKRIFDILVGLIGCVLLIPVAMVVKIAYLLTGDFHPIMYSQNRVGKNGKIFKMYKFRSMSYTADEDLKKLLKQAKYKKQWQKYQKLDPDPRVTKVGKIIRQISVDEFPQFMHLATGTISLIGPRPLLPGEIEDHHGNAKLYQSVKPGLTGWWAANGRSETTYKERLELEYYYIKNRSILLDLKVIFLTFLAVVKKDGAK